MLHAIAEALLSAVAPTPGAGGGVPDPGGGIPPPGSGNFLKILSWGKWIAMGICVAGFMGSGAQMAISSRRGEGGEHASRLGWIFFGSIIVGSAVGFVTALI
jgi:hypothetical protein